MHPSCVSNPEQTSPMTRPVVGQRRWPAVALVVILLAYAAAKAVFASQGRLGLPTGPVVPPAAHDAYFLDPALAQWCAAGTGVLAAGLVLATTTRLVHRVPRPLLLTASAVLLLGVGAGAVVMIIDGFGGPGPGWSWYHGVLGTVSLALLAALVRSVAVRTRPGPPRTGR